MCFDRLARDLRSAALKAMMASRRSLLLLVLALVGLAHASDSTNVSSCGADMPDAFRRAGETNKTLWQCAAFLSPERSWWFEMLWISIPLTCSRRVDNFWLNYRLPSWSPPTHDAAGTNISGASLVADLCPRTCASFGMMRVSCTPPLMRSADASALRRLYESTAGSGWKYNHGWGERTTCNAAGVACDSSGAVVGMDLSNNALTGALPSEVGHLTDVKWLDLTSNSLNGSLPTDIGRLTAVKGLAVRSATFTSSLPTQLGRLTGLESYLDLASNWWHGTLPSQLAQLTRLRTMFSDNPSLRPARSLSFSL